MEQVHNKLKVSFAFFKQGTKVQIDEENNCFFIEQDGMIHSYDRRSTIILDVGNCLEKGVIDLHHLENGFFWKGNHIVSATKFITMFPSYLNSVQNQQEITMIVHEHPDFDCIAASFLTIYYLNNKRFPPFVEHLAAYAEEIDTGKKKLHPSLLFNPYSITLVLGETVKGNVACIEKGHQLMEYILRRFEQLQENERDLDSPVLFDDDHPFQLEEKLIKEDYTKYINDVETICEKRTMLLPTLDGKVKEVDGLFWLKEPTCLLNRLWARSDATSPSGKGYIFTFVPFPSKKVETSWDKTIVTNRVIISVDGNSDVTLLNLGKELELAEQKKELVLFGEKLRNQWRTRDSQYRRFPEGWADNGDPWYDGRRDNHQIVDAPRTGSLLSIEEIKDIVLQFTKPKVKENKTKLLYPFQLGNGDFSKIYHSLKQSERFQLQKMGTNLKTVRYFRPYIQKYLFSNENDETTYSYLFETAEIECFIQRNEKNELEIVTDLSYVTSPFYIKIRKISIFLFRYGVGFIAIDTNIESKEENILFEQLLKENQQLTEREEGKKIIFSYIQSFIPDLPVPSNEENGIFYGNVTIQSSYFQSMKNELKHTLSSYLLLSTLNDSNRWIEREDRMFGFSKKGSILISFEKSTSQMTEEQKEFYWNEWKREEDQYETTDFYIFLLVLHQRYALLNFSKELSEIGVKSKEKKIARLRDILYEFMIQGWFSQITDDEDGLKKYKKWSNVFETETLYEEVIQQVSTIADYENAKKEKDFNFRFTVISFIFLIITGISGFFGMNLPIIKQFSNEGAVIFSIISTIGILILWYGIFLFGRLKK